MNEENKIEEKEEEKKKMGKYLLRIPKHLLKDIDKTAKKNYRTHHSIISEEVTRF